MTRRPHIRHKALSADNKGWLERLESFEVLDGSPFSDSFNLKHDPGEILGKDGEDIINTSGRWGADALEAMFMGSFADLLGEAVVVAEEVGCRQIKRVARGHVGQVEHLHERGADLPKLAGQEVADAEALSRSLPCELGRDAGTSRTQVQDRIAVRRVEPTATTSCPLTAARIESGGLVSVADGGQRRARQPSDLSRVERRHLRR